MNLSHYLGVHWSEIALTGSVVLIFAVVISAL
jgi:hypothetical protein